MPNPVKRRLAWAMGGACLLAATTFTGAQNQGSPGTGEPIELFAKLMPVFTHPRCANCHGGVDPFFPYMGPPAVKHGAGPIGDPTDPLEKRNEECSDCHNQPAEVANTWILASQIKPDRNFVGKDTQQMCEEQAFEVINMPKHTSRNWLQHLEEDVLITQSFIGKAGGQRRKADPPPMTRDDFLNAARAWVAAGGGCTWRGTIKQTETLASNYAFPTPGGKGTTTVLQSASRSVIIARDPGATTADIKMSGQLTQTSVENSECRPTAVISADWSNDSAAKPAAVNVSFQIAPDGSYTIWFRGPPEKTLGTDSLTTSSSCGSLPNAPPSSTDLDWDPWKFAIRCPPTPLINTARGDSIDCNAFDATKSPRLKGKMTRVVVDHWDAAERQSWLTESPASISRADTGESLPVTVVTEWDFELDKLSPEAQALRQ